MLVPEAWKRVVQQKMGSLLAVPLVSRIDSFFAEQNLHLPPNQTWREIKAEWFKVVDGKRILFENDDSLFHQLRHEEPSVLFLREEIALAMQADEIHADVPLFFNRMMTLARNDT
ncbi:MAG: hypothetical protein HQL99_08735 [Magnetococcales bacterium]|nr:hypothetical protein [Magnetococcales bacterium]